MNFDTRAEQFAANQTTAPISNIQISKSKDENRQGSTSKRVFAVAGTLISGLAALLATTMENKAANDLANNDHKTGSNDAPNKLNIDHHSTGSLPAKDNFDTFSSVNDIGPVPEIFEGVTSQEAEAAETELASLFGDFNSAHDSKTPSNGEVTPATPLSGAEATQGMDLVKSLGVSHPGQTISEIGSFPSPHQLSSNTIAIPGEPVIVTGIPGDAGDNSDDDSDNVIDGMINEDLVGTTDTDTLIGGEGDDRLFGLDGKDFLIGGKGADFIDGGDGDDDVVEYVGSETGVIVSLIDGLGYSGDAEGDTLVNVEFVHGSMHDDWIEGDDSVNRLEGRLGNDELFGLGGNDRLLGGYGADLLDGGDGFDTADYSWSDQGVVVDLSTGLGQLGEAEGDVLVSIENLAGSISDDTLIGNNEVNRLWGNDGSDTLRGGGGNDRLDGGMGADLLDGGEGTDIADYSNAQSGVTLSLISGGISGEAQGDSYISIENVYGSAFNDNIAGDNNANRLVGNGGDDVLYGAGGNDYIIGGLGNDILIGGAGADVFIFEGEFGNDIITDMWAGENRTDRIWLKDQGVDNWNELQSNMHQIGDDVVLELDYGTITLQDTLISDLHMDDFIFG